jgi:hypothetical protein
VDFPKSVPGVGLVNGKFIDEDSLAATPGSLIPSAWGNLITQELLNVIEGAGLDPDEADNTQLKVAIDKLIGDGAVQFATQQQAEAGTDTDKAMSALRVFQAIAKVVKQATESAFGWLKIGTQAQVNVGTDDTVAITPKKLAAAAQGQVHTAFTTGGAAAAFTLDPSPPIAAYAPLQRFCIKFSVAAGESPTLNVSAKGAKNLKQYDLSGSKISAVFAAGQISDVVYDGADFVLLSNLRSLNKTTSPFDATPGLVTVTGDGGWNSSGTPAAALVSDADAWTVSGSARTGPAWTGSPYPGAQGRNQGTLLHQCGFSDATYASQLFLGISSDNLWFRRKTANVWGAPVELWHTGNLAAKAQCTAWVNFNGTGTVAIRDSYNCLSVTDNGTGDYTINWLNQTKATYSYSSGTSVPGGTSGSGLRINESAMIYTATQLRLCNGSGTSGISDCTYGSVQIFGGQ